MSRTSRIGPLLQAWRSRRRRSQLDLALAVGVSARHLSFVETGRSRPSAELVLALAEHLEVPLRERNTLLLAAGYAPRYSQRSIDDPALRHVRASIQQMLDAHDPYPGVLIDRQWNVVLANRAASALTVGVPDHLLGPPLNVYRLCLHPDGLARRTRNFADWSAYLLGQLGRTIALTDDAELQELDREVRSYPGVVDPPPDGVGTVRGSADDVSPDDDPPLLVPIRLEAGGEELSMFTTLTMFGTPRDITLDELAIELFFPADDRTDELLRATAPAVAAGAAR